jgi:arylsulfatase A-like enzyme
MTSLLGECLGQYRNLGGPSSHQASHRCHRRVQPQAGIDQGTDSLGEGPLAGGRQFEQGRVSVPETLDCSQLQFRETIDIAKQRRQRHAGSFHDGLRAWRSAGLEHQIQRGVDHCLATSFTSCHSPVASRFGADGGCHRRHCMCPRGATRGVKVTVYMPEYRDRRCPLLYSAGGRGGFLMAEFTAFQGRIGPTVAQSEPCFDEPAHPGEHAPDVVIILLDDTGFAQLGCYGSDIDTPTIDALAAGGLQFTNFHVTPLCSPTRAALLTGRANHAVGMRSVSNFATGFPNQLGHITNHAATVAEVLGDAGYATFAVGKWHLAPLDQCSAAGPFDQWPLGRGFHRFYGFLEGETDQFHPELIADNHPVDPPHRDDAEYHLSEDLVDQALRMVADSVGIRPDRPCLTYLAFGATHAPHQAPAEYMAKYRGRFDEGWDVVRERWFAKQLDRGVVPPHTRLAPHNPGVKPWAELSDVERRLAARLQEAFAAFLDHTDVQIGRFLDGLKRLGRLDNTIVVLLADNGASQEGGPFGVLHEMKFFNFIIETPDQAIDRIDDIGGPQSHTNYPWGWAQCGNTPFRWYKQNTHEGGVHVPMILHWPTGLPARERGSRRDQFVFVADIVPTLYELIGVQAPSVRRGVEQLPVTGASFAALLHDSAAPATNRLQYFENGGSRALVADGWKAVCKHLPGADYDTEPWELYDLVADPSETEDLAQVAPDRLRQLIDLWWVEAQRHGVLPLDDRGVELFATRFRDRSPHPANRRYVYRPPMSPMPGQAGAAIAGRNVDMTARLTLTADDEGALFATGTQNAGLSWFVQRGRLVLDYNAFGDHVVLESHCQIPEGEVEVHLQLRRGEGRRGTATLVIAGDVVGTVDLPLYMRMISSIGHSIGHDHGSPVSPRYEAPFPFTGALHELVIQTSPERFTDVDAALARAETARQ